MPTLSQRSTCCPCATAPPHCTGDVIELTAELGSTLSYSTLKENLLKHKPAVLFLCQVRAGHALLCPLCGLQHKQHRVLRSQPLPLQASRVVLQAASCYTPRRKAASCLGQPPQVCAACHLPAQGESSTGTHQSLAGLSEVCKQTGTLLLVDTVCSLGGVPLFADAWGVDAIYSGGRERAAA